MKQKELQIHRILLATFLVVIIFLLSRTLELSHRTVELAGQILKNWEQITSLAEFDLKENEINLTNLVILRAIGEDYPSKKKLGEREWCKDRTCLSNKK